MPRSRGMLVRRDNWAWARIAIVNATASSASTAGSTGLGRPGSGFADPKARLG